MKTSSVNSRLLSILAFCSVMLFCLTTQPVKAQDLKKFAIGPGIGIGLGFFSPSGVNEYINADLSEYITTNADLYMYEDVKLFLNIKTKWFDVVPLVEYAFGPKVVVGADESYFFNRLSPGATFDFFIPMGMSGKYALFLGAGAQYHMMTFEDYKGEGLGYRFQIGFDLQFGSFNLQPTIVFNLAKIENVFPVDFDNRALDYTGGGISINMSFHKPVGH